MRLAGPAARDLPDALPPTIVLARSGHSITIRGIDKAFSRTRVHPVVVDSSDPREEHSIV